MIIRPLAAASLALLALAGCGDEKKKKDDAPGPKGSSAAAPASASAAPAPKKANLDFKNVTEDSLKAALKDLGHDPYFSAHRDESDHLEVSASIKGPDATLRFYDFSRRTKLVVHELDVDAKRVLVVSGVEKFSTPADVKALMETMKKSGCADGPACVPVVKAAGFKLNAGEDGKFAQLGAFRYYYLVPVKGNVYLNAQIYELKSDKPFASHVASPAVLVAETEDAKVTKDELEKLLQPFR